MSFRVWRIQTLSKFQSFLSVKHVEHAMQICTNIMESFFSFRYDFDSVMHYRAKAFSVNGENTIVPKDTNIDISRFGQRDGFSQIDKTQINKAYKVKEKNKHQTLIKVYANHTHNYLVFIY